MQTTPWKKKKGKQKKRKHFFAVWYRPGKEREGEFVYITLNLWILNYSNMLLDLLFIASLRRLTARRTWKWQEAGEVMGGVAWRRQGKVVGKLCVRPSVSRDLESVWHLVLLSSNLPCVTSHEWHSSSDVRFSGLCDDLVLIEIWCHVSEWT